MNLTELLTTHSAAGARYAAATIELHKSLIELAAVDEALLNANTGFDGRANIQTFFNLPQNLGTLAHPIYAPADTTTDLRDEIKARRNDIISTFNR